MQSGAIGQRQQRQRQQQQEQKQLQDKDKMRRSEQQQHARRGDCWAVKSMDGKGSWSLVVDGFIRLLLFQPVLLGPHAWGYMLSLIHI